MLLETIGVKFPSKQAIELVLGAIDRKFKQHRGDATPTY